MAQVILRVVSQELSDETTRGVADVLVPAVNRVHYGKDTVEPGDISLFVPVLSRGLCVSDAHFEVEVSEGSDNWPRDKHTGELLTHDLARQILDDRAMRVSQALRQAFGGLAHNIFEVTGLATGWVQYKPSE